MNGAAFILILKLFALFMALEAAGLLLILIAEAIAAWNRRAE